MSSSTNRTRGGLSTMTFLDGDGHTGFDKSLLDRGAIRDPRGRRFSQDRHSVTEPGSVVHAERERSIDHDRDIASRRIGLELLEHLEAGEIGHDDVEKDRV